MERRYQRWFSPALQRDMELLVFGHAGDPWLAFPTSQGRFFDWENNGLVAALAPALHAGRLLLVCADSVDSESWYAAAKPPGERVLRHAAYDRYLDEEVIPLLRWLSPDGIIGSAGCSFGAYHAVSFALRRPHVVHRAIGLSGVYDMAHLGDVDEETGWPIGGYTDEAVAAHDPCDYVAHEHDPARIEGWRSMDLWLSSGCRDGGVASHHLLSQALCRRDVPHSLTWVPGVAHEWSSWRELLAGRLGR